MKKIVFDLDDYGEFRSLDCLPILLELKERFPALKVTLFGIPYFLSPRRIAELHETGWIEIGMHGWAHLPWGKAFSSITGELRPGDFECKLWSNKMARRILSSGEQMGFVKGFKAPYWAISPAVIDALVEEGWWLADHPDNQRLLRPGLKVYFPNSAYSVHGHAWPSCGNYVGNLISNPPFEKDSRFFLISEVLSWSAVEDSHNL